MNRHEQREGKLPPARVEQLVRASVRGDTWAFETLFASAEVALYRMGLAMTGRPEDAEEALAETALAILEDIDGLRSPRYFYTWATRIMINACHALGRQRGKVVPIAEPEDVDAGSVSFQGDSGWADQADLQAALGKLSEEHRTVVVLRYLEDMSVSEVAELLDVPEGTVKSRLHHALRKLRVRLADTRTSASTGGASRE